MFGDRDVLARHEMVAVELEEDFLFAPVAIVEHPAVARMRELSALFGLLAQNRVTWQSSFARCQPSLSI